ncbi:MAG: hypothetical protein WED00_19545 [Aquisalimonadaceae bacterium]
MRVRDLVESWNSAADKGRTAEEFRVRLHLGDAARLAALRDMFPSRTEEELITDLLAAALQELEESLPYIPGQRITAEDEHGDPIHEDVGPTPRFQELTRKHLQRLQRQQTRQAARR